MKYTIIPNTTLENLKISEEHTLNSDEIQRLIVHKDLIRKFIEQRAFAIQLDIWSWVRRKNPELWFQVVEELSKIWQEIWNMEEVFWKYQEELKHQEELKNKNL